MNNVTSDPLPEKRGLWQACEALADALAESPSLEQACATGLRLVLQAIQRPFGRLLVQQPGETGPALIVDYGPSEAWGDPFINGTESAVQQAAYEVLQSGQPISGREEIGLAAAVGLPAGGVLQGVLLVGGSPLSAAEAASLAELARRLGRAIRLFRNGWAAGQKDWDAARYTLRALFESLSAVVYAISPTYRLMAANPATVQRSRTPLARLLGSVCYQALYGRSEPCPGCRVMETLQGGAQTLRMERRWNTEEDASEWEIITYPICAENGQVLQALLLEHDITEKRRLENILVQSEKLAAVGQLAAGVAHEISNPLTAILANAQLLQRGLPADDELQESVDLISRAGARAAQVVRNLLDFARKEQYHLSLTDINDSLERALALVQHELVTRSIQLIFEPAVNLPTILASQDHLQGVWLNLLMNAIDAIDKTPGMLQVSTRRNGAEIRVAIQDNGKGIPAERLGRIFEPFYTTKAPGHGTGLGLSVAHGIIKQHGGNIRVESVLGEGSTFTVVLPVT